MDYQELKIINQKKKMFFLFCCINNDIGLGTHVSEVFSTTELQHVTDMSKLYIDTVIMDYLQTSDRT